MIRFTTSRVPKSKILSIDNGEFSDIVDMTDDYIHLRLVFNLNLMSADNSPTNYKKVIVSLKREGYDTDIETVTSTTSDLKINQNPTDFSLVRPLPDRHPTLNANGIYETRNVPSRIPPQAAQKIIKSFSVVSNYIKTKNTQDKITSCTVYVGDYVLNALKNPYETNDLSTPEKVSLDQGQRLHQDKISKNDILVDVNKHFISPVSVLTSGDESDFYKKFTDYFIHDAPLPPRDYIDSLTFYKPVKNLRYLNELEIPCYIKLPTRFANSNITAIFDLYSVSSIRPVETVSAQLDIKKLIEAYKVIDGTVNVDYSTRNADSSFSKSYLASFSYTGDDIKKIKLFNVYTKPFTNYGNKISAYNLKASLTPEKISEITSLAFLEKNSESLQVVRVVPVTDAGESSNFSDVVLGESISTNLSSNLVLTARQADDSAIRVDIHNINTKFDFLKIYRRKCKKTVESNFVLAASYRRAKAKSFTWFDSEIIPGETYEYYAVVESTDNLEQISNYCMSECRVIAKNKSQGVVFEKLITNSEKISFIIRTMQRKSSDNSNDLYNTALASSYGNATTQTQTSANNIVGAVPTGLNPTVEKTFQPPRPEDYKNLFFHSVTRIDMTNGDRETFNLVADGEFIDDSTSRRQEYVSRPIPGRSYVYEVQTFVRDPLTVKKDFLITGEKNNSVWFNRPYKWKNPSVLSTGILFSDDEDGIPEIQNFENYAAEFIGTSVTSEITLPSVPKYEPINPISEKISRSVVKVSWQLPEKKNFYDSFVIVKVVNGARSILGKTKTGAFYHKLTNDDLGTVYYEVTCLLSDFSIDRTYHSNELIIEEDLSYKSPRITA